MILTPHFHMYSVNPGKTLLDRAIAVFENHGGILRTARALRSAIHPGTLSATCGILDCSTYQAVMQKKPKTYHIMPLKIFSYRDTMYLHARMAREPGKVYREPDYDPLLAIHRLKKAEITDRSFEYPPDYQFEAVFDQRFGVMKDGCFDVDAVFTGWAADHVAERTWSTDQKITRIGDDKIHLEFSASSREELIAWLLSFGENVQVMAPDWLVDEIKNKIERTADLYKPASLVGSERV